MIDDKIKEAYRMLGPPVDVDSYEMATVIIRLRDAYVQAEARARMWEWKIDHDEYSCNAGVCCSECGQLSNWDERHKWTIADWEREVREELKK